jgi:peptide/nickel transport system ATP-binding protein
MERIWGAQMALVPQDPLSSLNPSLTIRQQMTELLQRHQNLTRPQAYHRTLELLTSVNLPDPNRVAASYPHQLSGGQQQRVMIALSLSTDPALLILDEPTTSLDVTTEAAMLDLFRRLINDHQTAALYVSHNLGVVARISDRVAVLYAGELVEDASTVELYQQALHPYTQGLLDSVPRLGLNKASQTLPSMSGSIPSLRAIPSGCVFAPRCPIAVERCFEERPSLDVLDSGRKVRCHRWPEIQQGTLVDHKRTATEGHHAAPTALINPKKPILAVKNLQKHFANRRLLSDWLNGEPPSVVKAVDDVSFEIPAGQTLALVGESGSGKTTVSRMVMALLADSGGQMELFGVALPAQLKHRDLDTLRQLQMVFQNPEEALNPYFTVAESLRRPLQILNGLSRAEASQRIPGLLDMVRLPAEFAHRLPGQLSGGEKQRVAIARAFAVQPQLVVCDEPVSALDVSVQAAVLNLLNDLQRQQGSAYLFISHDLAVVSYLADHIAVIYLGQLMESGPTAALLSPPYHPYTEALLSAVPQPDPTHQGQEIRLAGDIPSATNTPSGCPFHTRCPRFVGQVCIDERPPWRTVSPGHRIRCHIPTAELQAAQDEIVS